ncbi:MAG: hypothetical protein AAGI38_13840 [Bacteroidota bacterium]
MKYALPYIFLSVLLVLPFGSRMFAQGSMGLTGHYAQPLNSLDAGNYRWGGGGALELFTQGYDFGMPLRLQLGGSFGYTFSGQESNPVELQDFEGVMVDQLTRNYSLAFHGIARFISPEARVRFYLDGIIGSRGFISDQVLQLEELGSFNGDDCPKNEQDNINTDWTLVYGAGAGTMIYLTEGVSLDLRATYSRGSRASYVDLESVNSYANEVEYSMNQTFTDMLLISVGVSFRITGCDGSMSDGNGASRSYKGSESSRFWRFSPRNASSPSGTRRALGPVRKY